MKDQLRFDVTSADTIADSDKVGIVRLAEDGTTLLTSTTDGAREAIDVYTELGQDEDSVHTSGDKGVMALGVRNDAGTALAADGDYIPLSVNASGELRVAADLSVTNSGEKAEDSAHVSADIGGYVLAVRADTRPTDANTDADGDYASFFVNDNGELYVKDTDVATLLTQIDVVLDNILVDTNAMVVDLAAIEVELLDQGTTLDTIAGDTTSIDATLTSLTKAEDSVHVSGDDGIMSLAVRNDAGTPLAADGDYIPLSTDANGDLRVVTNTADDALANGSIVESATTVGVVATDLRATDLADRKYAFVYNNGNRKSYIGGSGVTSSTGFPVSPGSYIELRIGDAIDIHAISDGAGQDFRILELA